MGPSVSRLEKAPSNWSYTSPRKTRTLVLYSFHSPTGPLVVRHTRLEDIWTLKNRVVIIMNWTLTWPTIRIAHIVKSILVQYLLLRTSFLSGFWRERRITNRNELKRE